MALRQSSRPKRKTTRDANRPACPKCKRPMTVRQVSPLLFAEDMDDVVYGCEECGTTKKQTVTR